MLLIADKVNTWSILCSHKYCKKWPIGENGKCTWVLKVVGTPLGLTNANGAIPCHVWCWCWMCGKIVSRNDGKWLHHNTPDCIDCITHLGSPPPPRPHCYYWPFPAWPVARLTNSLMMGISCNCYCLYTDTQYLERDNLWSRSFITTWHCRLKK